jgi:hypothetical protein
MIDGLHQDHIELGALAKNVRIRVLNCSVGGCLIESDVPIDVGTVGILRISLGAQIFSDAVEVIRCQAIAGGGGIHHVGTRLLPTTAAYQGSLRQAMSLDRAALAGWPTTEGAH